MADIINLRQALKAKARKAAADAGAAARAKHGRGKAERDAQDAEADRAARTLDGHRRADATSTTPEDPPRATFPDDAAE